jgi:Flp pilus assembly protein TadG
MTIFCRLTLDYTEIQFERGFDGSRMRVVMRFQRTANQRGSVLVEMAIVLPVLLLLILGGIDLDLMTTSKSGLNFVAGETARCMAQNPLCQGPATFAQQQATGLGLNGRLNAISIPPTPCPQLPSPPPPGPTCSVTVTVTYGWTPLSPFFHPVTLTSVATSVQ